MNPLPAPVTDLDEARRRVDEARAEGAQIVLTNGCFDLLHVGHVRYLEAARQHGDYLVVGINGDATVARTKGEGRPVLPAATRAEIVASIRGVDLVTIFDQPTAEELILALRPDVHCKGTDYRDGVPEAATVVAVGGRVEIVGDEKRHSTRDLLARMRAGS